MISPKKERKLVRFTYPKWKPAPDWVYETIAEETRQNKINTWEEVAARKWVLLYSDTEHDIVDRNRAKSVGSRIAAKANELQVLENVAVIVYGDDNMVRVEQTVEEYLLLFGNT